MKLSEMTACGQPFIGQPRHRSLSCKVPNLTATLESAATSVYAGVVVKVVDRSSQLVLLGGEDVWTLCSPF